MDVGGNAQMPRKFRKTIIYIMIATLVLGTIFAGVAGLGIL